MKTEGLLAILDIEFGSKNQKNLFVVDVSFRSTAKGGAKELTQELYMKSVFAL